MVSLFDAAHAQESLTQATVAATSGSATIRFADGSSAPATVGLKVAQGAAITTGKGAQVSLLVHDGIVAVLAGNTEVGLEKLSVGANGTRNAILSLKSGSLASSLDPSRKSENNYGVRTAKGLALARGTDLTVTVNGNVYLVAVLSGTVTVNWGGQSVNITGNTANAVTTNNNGVTTSGTLGAAMTAGGSAGLTEALTAAAAAVATVATNTAQVTALINTIATAAGTSATASTTVASVTAAATGAAVTNATLVAAAGSGGTTSLASTITTAAVTSATAAGNGGAAALIVSSAVNAVADSIPGTLVNAVVQTLVAAANNVQGVTIKPGQVTGGVHASQNEKGTPVTPVDPAITVVVSRSS